MVAENSAAGSLVVTVHAVDPDTNSDAAVKYSFPDGKKVLVQFLTTLARVIRVFQKYCEM